MTEGLRKLTLMLTCLFIAQVASAQTMPELLKAFRKLEAGTEAGITRSDYARGMAEVTAQMRNFQDVNPNRQPESFRVLQSAFSHYKKVQDLLDEEEELTRKYDNHKVSINAYYDRREEMVKERVALWKSASAELDRAAKLISSKK